MFGFEPKGRKFESCRAYHVNTSAHAGVFSWLLLGSLNLRPANEASIGRKFVWVLAVQKLVPKSEFRASTTNLVQDAATSVRIFQTYRLVRLGRVHLARIGQGGSV